MSKHILCGIALVLLLLSGCASNPDVQVVELSKNTVVYDEIVRINNCGGKGDSEQTKSRDFATTVEFGAGVSAGYQSIVQGSLSAKYSEYRNTSGSQRLVAPPGTNMEFVLRWSDDVRAGNVQVNGKSGTYEVRIPVSVEQVSSRDLGCGTMQQNTQPTPIYQPIPTQRTAAPPLNCGMGTPLPHRAPVVGQPWILPSGGWIIVNFWSNEPGVDQTEHKLLLGPNDPRTLLGGGSAWQWPIECESVVRENYRNNPLPPITLEDLRAQGLVR